MFGDLLSRITSHNTGDRITAHGEVWIILFTLGEEVTPDKAFEIFIAVREKAEEFPIQCYLIKAPRRSRPTFGAKPPDGPGAPGDASTTGGGAGPG